MTTVMSVEAPTTLAKAARRTVIGLLLAVLLYRALLFLEAAMDAIKYPWQLDYGEGIVWQQMRWIFTSRAYGSIDGFPAIVFHYPPVFHAITAICAKTLGTDELATGRSISILSTFAAAFASAILVDLLRVDRASREDRFLCAGIAGLLVLTYLPVILWATLMRVDMLAIALDLFGLVAAFKSLERPRYIYVASLLFVAAVYTKQTALAAPVATFAILLIARPPLALRGIAFSLIVGTTILMSLVWLTGGGFYRHIFLYNMNRLDFTRLWWIIEVIGLQAIYLVPAVFVLAQRLRDLRSKYRLDLNARVALGASVEDIRLLIAVGYLLVSTVMLILVAKIGSNINYFLDWFFALGLFVALSLTDGRPLYHKPELRFVLGVGIPLCLLWGSLFAPSPQTNERSDSLLAHDMTRLARMIASADKPVISDDMVVLIRGGQDVLWESAIFRELGSTGRWDERPFVQRIRNHQFAFFVTLGDRGQYSYSQRYSPRVADAIDAEYPVREEIAGRIIHRPLASTQLH